MSQERPILFKAPMVRAILDGTKTQTRRIVKRQPSDEATESCWCKPTSVIRHVWNWVIGEDQDIIPNEPAFFCPYGQPGDRLWVRETWRHIDGGVMCDSSGGVIDAFEPETLYRSDAPNRSGPWNPSIFMPRWASRITLEIVSIRVERLNDITVSDAITEGYDGSVQSPIDPSIKWYAALWESINGPGSWDKNPWVWVVEFKRVQS